MAKVKWDEVLTSMATSGDFRVRDDGRIETRVRWNGHKYLIVDWYLCDRADGCGYLYVSFKQYRVKAHRLAYALYTGGASLGDQEINHIDGDPLNNRRENLELCGPERQSQHAYDVGLNWARGVDHPLAKLTPDSVRQMRALRTQGLTLVALAKQYGVTPRAVHLACMGRTWAHVA